MEGGTSGGAAGFGSDEDLLSATTREAIAAWHFGQTMTPRFARAQCRG
ncbi:Hypothetical protein (plasmid) [Pseudomonas putida]|nr:Hypothetical protein [Pseudomonas putida]